MGIAADAESFHVITGLGKRVRNRIDDVMDFVFRIRVGVIQGQNRLVEEDHDAGRFRGNVVREVVDHRRFAVPCVVVMVGATTMLRSRAAWNTPPINCS